MDTSRLDTADTLISSDWRARARGGAIVEMDGALHSVKSSMQDALVVTTAGTYCGQQEISDTMDAAARAMRAALDAGVPRAEVVAAQQAIADLWVEELLYDIAELCDSEQ